MPRVSRWAGSRRRDGSVADSTAAETRADACHAEAGSSARRPRSRGGGEAGRAMGTRSEACL